MLSQSSHHQISFIAINRAARRAPAILNRLLPNGKLMVARLSRSIRSSGLAPAAASLPTGRSASTPF
jgi:hypothetical protein